MCGDFASCRNPSNRCHYVWPRLNAARMSLFSKPKYSTVRVKKKNIPEGLWKKCPVSGDFIFTKELEQNQMVVPSSGHHFAIEPSKRLQFLLDEDSFEEKDAELASIDTLKFQSADSY